LTTQPDSGFRRTVTQPSLPEVYRSVPVARNQHWLRRFFAFSGPGYLVAVGYMDPGNWATSIAGGSAYGYTLLSVILLSNFMAILLQALSVKLGIATGRDLAQACRDHYSRPVGYALWVICELAIIATDLAEVIGTAIGLTLLFGIPLLAGVILTAVDVLLILMLQNRGFRYIEAFIIALMVIIGSSFIFELALSLPVLSEVMAGFIPDSEVVTNPGMLYLAIGILGATVMPHNLYLHSAIVQTRDFERSQSGKRDAIKMATLDSTIALLLALFVNAGILILAASTFYKAGYNEVAEIQDAYYLLSPLLGIPVASTIFAIALLASGQNSTITATLAGQIVMEGFLDIRLPPWMRRLITRLLAIIPAIFVTIYFGESGAAKLLVFSQVILSLQLPFAIVPLVNFTSDHTKMGTFVNPKWLTAIAWAVTLLIIALNIKLIIDFLAF
jgi:manganese transport protein